MSQTCKVLIVDDEPLIRQGLKHYIDWEQEGFSIVGEASNGKEAYGLIQQLEPHIVITDMVMPLMDGEELTKLIKQDYPNVEVIILSSFGDFEYVRSTFQSGVADYILKPKLDGPELLTVLKKISNRIPNNLKVKNSPSLSNDAMIEKLMSGYQMGEISSQLKRTFPFSHFYLVGMKGENKELESLLHGLFLNIDFHSSLLASEDFDTLILLNIEENHFSAIRYHLHHISLGNPTICLMVSNGFTSLQSIKTVYEQQLLKMLHIHFYLPEQTILFNMDVPKEMIEEKNFNLQQFTDSFRCRQFERAFQYLEEYINYLCTSKAKDVHGFKSFLGNMIFNITNFLSNMDFPAQQLDKDKYFYFTAIDQARHVHEARDVLQKFINEAKLLIDSEKHPEEPNFKRLLDYIDRHYMEPISLSSMAEVFHFNPSYLSTYFSTHKGEGFSEYVSRIRIERAIELLQEKNIPISEISQLVGYSDHSYFCKVFKKSTGMSPSSYQKQFFTYRK